MNNPVFDRSASDNIIAWVLLFTSCAKLLQLIPAHAHLCFLRYRWVLWRRGREVTGLDEKRQSWCHSIVPPIVFQVARRARSFRCPRERRYLLPISHHFIPFLENKIHIHSMIMVMFRIIAIKNHENCIDETLTHLFLFVNNCSSEEEEICGRVHHASRIVPPTEVQLLLEPHP